MSAPAACSKSAAVMFANRDRSKQSIANSRSNLGRCRWRGKLPIPKHAHPLVRELFKQMNIGLVTTAEIASEAGVARAVVSDWRYRRIPRLDALEACLNVLGLRLVVEKVPE